MKRNNWSLTLEDKEEEEEEDKIKDFIHGRRKLFSVRREKNTEEEE